MMMRIEEDRDDNDDHENRAGNRASGLGLFADFRLPRSGWNHDDANDDDSDNNYDDDDDDDSFPGT